MKASSQAPDGGVTNSTNQIVVSLVMSALYENAQAQIVASTYGTPLIYKQAVVRDVGIADAISPSYVHRGQISVGPTVK